MTSGEAPVSRPPSQLAARRASRAERREQLLDATDRAVRAGGPETSMAAIAAEAGITKPILYREFGDKGGLYRALIERHAESLLAELRVALGTRGGTRARTRATVEAYLLMLDEHEESYRFLMAGEAATEPSVAGLVASFEQRFGDELARGLRFTLGIGEDDPQADIWAHGIAGLVRGAGDWWLRHRHEIARADVVEPLTALVCDGLLGGRGTPQD
jgi:AcrR family transcriptional regulator